MIIEKLLPKLRGYFRLLRLDKPIGIYLLLWPTLWGLWLAAEGTPTWWVLFVFVCGVILTRSAGCAINDYADRLIDGEVQRTKNRPLISGEVTPREALILFAVLMLIAFALVLSLNLYTILLSCVAVLLAASYPFMKRYHHMPQAHLGAAFAMSIPMAFATIQNSVPWLAWLLFIAAVLWTIAYDTLYAMADREEDMKIGVKSSAIWFGKYDRIIIAGLQLLFLGLLIVVGNVASLHGVYFAALGFCAALFVYQHYLIEERQPKRCFDAFLNNSWVGLIVFLGIMLSFWLG